MGLFSSSKSKSSSKTYVNTTTQNAGFSEVAGPAISSQGEGNSIAGNGNIGFRGNSNNINVLDGGAIARAFDFAENANTAAQGSVRESVAAVTESARAETENIASQIKTVLIYGVVIWGGVQAFKAFKG